jgi:hypothetical protein
MRSVATKSSVCSSISKISRTLPDAIFLMLYWLRSTLVTALSEDILKNNKRVYDIVLAKSCPVLRRGGSCGSNWLVTGLAGVLIFLRAKSENLRHKQGPWLKVSMLSTIMIGCKRPTGNISKRLNTSIRVHRFMTRWCQNLIRFATEAQTLQAV